MRMHQPKNDFIECYYDGGQNVIAAHVSQSFQLPGYVHRVQVKDSMLGQMLVGCLSIQDLFSNNVDPSEIYKRLEKLLTFDGSPESVRSFDSIMKLERDKRNGFVVAFPADGSVVVGHIKSGIFDRMVCFDSKKYENFYASERVGVFINNHEIPESCWEYPQLDLADSHRERLSMMIERQFE